MVPTCVVCFEDVTEDVVCAPDEFPRCECQCYFHRHCWRAYQRYHHTCPMCRRPQMVVIPMGLILIPRAPRPAVQMHWKWLFCVLCALMNLTDWCMWMWSPRRVDYSVFLTLHAIYWLDTWYCLRWQMPSRCYILLHNIITMSSFLYLFHMPLDIVAMTVHVEIFVVYALGCHFHASIQ